MNERSERGPGRGRNRLGGLGRGLGALIPTAPAPEPETSSRTGPADAYFGSIAASAPARNPEPAPPAPDTGPLPVPGVTFADLPIASVHPNARQPRQAFDEDALAELAHSVREFGVLQPIVVRADEQGYELVMGERRLRAAAAAGLETVPAIIRSTADDAMLRDALLENIHRAQLNPLEEAAAYQQLLEEFGTTHDELAQRIGRSRPQVSNTIRLLNLPIPVQRRVAAGVLSAGHARALLGVDDPDLQEELASRIVAEGISVRATEELVALSASGHAEKKHTRRAPAQRITAPGIVELADRLSDAFDTRVRVEIGRRKGRITVEFASVGDLERIVAVMAPPLATQREETGAQPEPKDP
ncbi:MAG: chromosome partitioning protein ParB [Pseudonocardiales bacterium]|nr:MAG: chromosome partitioning protein ParB [Pseudonocardiales bacterium]